MSLSSYVSQGSEWLEKLAGNVRRRADDQSLSRTAREGAGRMKRAVLCREHQKQLLASWCCGAVLFRSALAVACVTSRAVRISSSSLFPIPSILGLGAVALSSVAVADTFKLSMHILSTTPKGDGEDTANLPQRIAHQVSSYARGFSPFWSTERVFYAVSGCAAFVLLGGRFRSVMSSDLFTPGSFARKRLPAPKMSSYVQNSAQEKLQRIGRRYGCHHCGRRNLVWLRKRAEYVGDHIPPSKFMRVDGFQDFFPQCSRCCGLQATAVRTSRRKLVLHRGHRLYHLWLPLPLFWIAFEPIWMLVAP